VCTTISICNILLQNLWTDEPVTHPSIDMSVNCKGNFKGKVKMITMPGWRQVVVQLSTNSLRHEHRMYRMYSVVQLGPSPFCQTLSRNKKVKFKCWTNWCCGQINFMLRGCSWIHGYKGDQVQTHCCQPQIQNSIGDQVQTHYCQPQIQKKRQNSKPNINMNKHGEKRPITANP
jgi:hypothetical protein